MVKKPIYLVLMKVLMKLLSSEHVCVNDLVILLFFTPIKQCSNMYSKYASNSIEVKSTCFFAKPFFKCK